MRRGGRRFGQVPHRELKAADQFLVARVGADGVETGISPQKGYTGRVIFDGFVIPPKRLLSPAEEQVHGAEFVAADIVAV